MPCAPHAARREPSPVEEDVAGVEVRGVAEPSAVRRQNPRRAEVGVQAVHLVLPRESVPIRLANWEVLAVTTHGHGEDGAGQRDDVGKGGLLLLSCASQRLLNRYQRREAD